MKSINIIHTSNLIEGESHHAYRCYCDKNNSISFVSKNYHPIKCSNSITTHTNTYTHTHTHTHTHTNVKNKKGASYSLPYFVSYFFKSSLG